MDKIKLGLGIMLILPAFFLLAGYAESACIDDTCRKCLAEFDMEKAVASKNDYSMRDFFSKNDYLPTNYFLCKAVQLGDIKECDKIPDLGGVKNCQAYFGKVEAVFGRLVKYNDAAGAYGAAKMYGVDHSEEPRYKIFLESILSRNESICRDSPDGEARNFCLACVKGKPSLSLNAYNRERAEYITALRTGDIKECSKIRKYSISVMCRASLSKNPEVCEDDKSYKDFKQLYCEEGSRIARQKEVRGGQKNTGN